MRKVIYVFILLFILMMGLQMGTDINESNLQDQIDDFEQKIENNEEMVIGKNEYIIDGGFVNDIAKKGENVIKGLFDGFKGLFN